MLPLPVLLQEAAQNLSDGLAAANSMLCSPLVTALQFHGVIPLLLLSSLWVASGYVRLQEVRRQRLRRRAAAAAISSGAASPQHSSQTLSSSKVLGNVNNAPVLSEAEVRPEGDRCTPAIDDWRLDNRTHRCLPPAHRAEWQPAPAGHHGGAPSARLSPAQHGELAVHVGTGVW